ncbi:hypothetical protein GJR96_10335 [Haloferax sp. MBLA0076]|uniref:Uncharacterized protein n=1 Tax=Haloferax litoreum TaxID=2666140 RepID=A0A6A8GGQ7_9EURY|nr:MULTISPECIES: hypothetical protein [Haloferax]KAB1193811.1 hypothetical protein Hfx1148_10295 [Haloferax sp. CBA1148]MRX22353.1 hypothetical protein [Haloferax litoreum]
MKRSLLVASTVVLLVAAGVGVAFVAGIGPFADGSDAGDQSTDPFPTQTATPTSDGSGSTEESETDGGTSGGDATSTSTATTAEPVDPFAFTIVRIEECGQTCRDVTSTLTNQQETGATGVTVYSRIFAGNSTASDDEIWRGSESVGDLDAGESYTTTRRVELSFSEAFAVQQADGWITIQTTIQTDQQTVTYTERRDVI